MFARVLSRARQWARPGPREDKDLTKHAHTKKGTEGPATRENRSQTLPRAAYHLTQKRKTTSNKSTERKRGKHKHPHRRRTEGREQHQRTSLQRSARATYRHGAQTKPHTVVVVCSASDKPPAYGDYKHPAANVVSQRVATFPRIPKPRLLLLLFLC